MEALLQELKTQDLEKLKEVLKAMTWLAMVNKGSEELYKAIEAVSIENEDLEVSGRSLQLLQQLLPECTPHIIHLLPLVINKFGSPHSIISRTAFNCIALASKAAPNEVIQAIKAGLKHENDRVRSSCLRSLSLMQNYVDSELMMDIIHMFNDPIVNNTALQTARRLIAIPELRDKLNNELVETIESGTAPEHIPLSPSRKPDVPRILDPDFAHHITSSSSWKEKLTAMEELKESLSGIGSELDKYLPGILDFLKHLLEETNYRIVIGALKLFQEMLEIRGITKKANFTPLIQPFIEKIGDEKLAFRQNTFKVFRSLMREMVPDTYFPYFLENLKNENWHIREGCLVLIMTAILEKNNSNYFDYSNLVRPVSLLLSDVKAKIRFVATETLVLLGQSEGISQVLDRVEADEVAIERLKARMKKKGVASLRDDWVELPKIIPGSAPVASYHNTGMSITETSEALSPTRFTTALNERLSSLARSSNLESPKPQEKPIVARSPLLVRKSSISGTPMSRSVNIEREVADDSHKRPAIKAVDVVYLKREELDPIENPELEFMEYLKSDPTEWSQQFEMLNKLRRLLKYNSSMFANAPIHSMVIQALKWADSLRSSLSKNALIVIGEMCAAIPKLVDPELESILNCLLRKSADTNVFISEQAEKSLVNVCKHCSDSRTIGILFQAVNSTRSSQIKAKTAMCFHSIFEHRSNDIRRIKELERMIQLLAALSREASAEVRFNAKAALNYLNSVIPSDFDKLLKRALNTNDYIITKESLSKVEAESPFKKILKNQEMIIRSPFRAKSSEPIDVIREDLNNDDWIRRVEAISKLKDLGIKSKTITSKSLHCLITGLNDEDSRVSMHTLTVISKLLPCTTNKPDISPLLPGLVNLLNSPNNLLRNNAKDVCRILIHQGDLSQILPSLLQCIKRDKDKAWLFLYTLLIDSLSIVYSQRPSLIHKYIIPYVIKLLEDGNIGGSERKLLERLHGVMGSDLSVYLGDSWEKFLNYCDN
ncbi:unnamed protein product [Blepharisma stoltei]|uniref:TOG domain-containing protein n=1 Tax=Blepharisma stoltei TaxID=1481888 RepID=A0AAU9KC71_9CILI|nr:unnamed protein product [Blepharisma stoltei]